jgi:hypothetical protein
MTDTIRYTSPGHRSVRADSASEAAAIFGAREARRAYGRRGYVRTMRLDCWTENGSSHTFEAFIGYDVGGGTTSGRNVWIYVDAR